MRLFFAWQSDIPENKKMIRKLVQKICDEMDIEYTEDTRNEAGGEHVIDVILRKIKNSDIFVSDMTIVGKSADGGSLSNSNVSYELGYAEAELSRNNIIMIMNEEYGSYNDMPFDLGKRMVTTFKTKNNNLSENDLKILRKELTSKIQSMVERDKTPHTSDIDLYEKTLLFWAKKLGEGFIEEGKDKDYSSNTKLAIGSPFSFLSSDSNYFFYKSFDKKQATFYRRALARLMSKGYLAEVDTGISDSLNSFGPHRNKDWVITPEGNIVASAILESEVKPILTKDDDDDQ